MTDPRERGVWAHMPGNVVDPGVAAAFVEECRQLVVAAGGRVDDGPLLMQATVSLAVQRTMRCAALAGEVSDDELTQIVIGALTGLAIGATNLHCDIDDVVRRGGPIMRRAARDALQLIASKQQERH